MAPWWLRPTAEGPAESAEKEAEPQAPQHQFHDQEHELRAPVAPTEEAEPLAAAPVAAEAILAGDEPAALTGEGEELPDGDDEEPGPGTPAGERRPRRRRSSRGRGRGGAGAATAAAATTEPPEAPVALAEARAAHVTHASEPARPHSWREEPRREPAPRGDGESISLGVPQLQEMIREIVTAVPERTSASYEEKKLAVFCDLENVAIGSRDTGISFDINLVLERLLEKGKIIVKKAYADWSRYGDYKRPFHEAGIELIDIPQRSYSGKNSADIKMVVDAMDLSYAKEHLDTFVLLSGDSDFSPLVSKLKENDKYVIGVGVKGSSSNLLIDSCDEFIYYEDIYRDVDRAPKVDALSKKEQEVFGLLIEAITALQRENKDVLWGSMIKQTMQRKRPSFNEGYYGYSTFSDLLEDAEKKNIVKLKKDQRSGSYIVTGFAGKHGNRR